MSVATGSTSELYQRYLALSTVAGVKSITVDQGRAAELWDVDGTKYLDCFAGISW
jgi:4-aminobutyrate aminotransferase-like enzyme